jgi:hypothetical protein
MRWGRRGPNKYGARTVRTADGLVFQSAGEGDRYRDLSLFEAAKAISGLKAHPTVKLFPGIKWRLDYSYQDPPGGPTVFEDFKGKETADFKLKVKLWEYLGEGTLRLSRREADGKIRVYKEVTPRGVDSLLKDLGRRPTFH